MDLLQPLAAIQRLSYSAPRRQFRHPYISLGRTCRRRPMPVPLHRPRFQTAAGSRQLLAYTFAYAVPPMAFQVPSHSGHTHYGPLLRPLLGCHSTLRGSAPHSSNMWQLQCHCMSVHAHRCESPPLFWHAASPMGLVPGGASSLPSCATCLDSAFEGLCPLVGPRAMCPECSLHVGYTILLLQSLLHVCMAIMASAPDPWSRAML